MIMFNLLIRFGIFVSLNDRAVQQTAPHCSHVIQSLSFTCCSCRRQRNTWKDVVPTFWHNALSHVPNSETQYVTVRIRAS